MKKALSTASILLLILLTGCARGTQLPPTATLTPAETATPTVDSFFLSQGGGEPRTVGYWLIWNSCAPDNRAELAAANGGREAGWIILDDLIEDPGVLVGELEVTSCQAGVHLLQAQDLDGTDRSGDPVYALAARLLGAQLNLAVGAEYCPAVDEAVRAGQLLLISLGFDGMGEYSSQMDQGQERDVAEFLIEQLASYNAGKLCR